MPIIATEFILYVADQPRSAAFYRTLLGKAPSLDVPGMTEFELGTGVKLGLMPEAGIARIISGPMPHPSTGAGVPRCELYLLVADLDAAVQRAARAGAVDVQPAADRDWGHRVAYFADPDGHVIALAAVVR
ncbi:MAG: VOC family protein [Flavobacteriales bacterium]|jgi:predicted enzyme related to lactoylglutathione lyase|nr:VOC family protein [Flavobacteriales bacterium]